jgi:3-oxoacyl-[acyl-carrier-protein] synthase III
VIGIRQIGVHRGVESLNNFELGETLGTGAEFLESKIGMLKLSRKSKDEDTSDLAVAAALALFESSELKPEDVQCLVLVTQNPDGGGLPHTSAIVHDKLGLRKDCIVFDIALGCSGFVQTLSVIKALMEAQGLKDGLLVTADPYSKIIDSSDRDTALIFGDGATATWMSDNPVWRIGATDGGILSSQNGALKINEKGNLFMNGRGVFNFAATAVPPSIERVLERSSNTMADIDLVLLHQGSRYIVETIARRIGAQDKAPFSSANYGNTISSSIPMMLAENVPATAHKLLLCGFGVGLAWATCYLERV